MVVGIFVRSSLLCSIDPSKNFTRLAHIQTKILEKLIFSLNFEKVQNKNYRRTLKYNLMNLVFLKWIGRQLNKQHDIINLFLFSS